ncbi:hypothetical protein [Pseudochryseolinea flava]|uniref:Phosphotyrosine protein phosphatase I domain-containing protein n=1 Tax=Pseudochryseolinea flava TaxID=2059302 RepID=A0A364Y6N0_9BACT|nr:hypothetical protein [Pseudochryseolinea flava]RAW02553.1 hypothetical protein DQQ10_00075 [Pseudochryseolinea flava]
MESNKVLVFLCSGAMNAGEKKLSYRIATQLESLGIAELGSLQDLSRQHATSPGTQRRMIFINNCRSKCLHVLLQGINEEQYIFFDVAPYVNHPDFDEEHYVTSEVLPVLSEKWIDVAEDIILNRSN